MPERARSLRARLTLAFVAVALAAIAGLAIVMLLVTRSETQRLSTGDRDRIATQVVREAARAFERRGAWTGADLSEALAVAESGDANLAIRDLGGALVTGRAGPGQQGGRGAGAAVVERPVSVAERRVGTAELRFRGALSRSQSVLRDKLARAVLLGSGIAVAIALLGAALVTRAISRPLRRLAGVARRLQQGDLAARAGASPAPGELGEVAEAFDAMARTLDHEAAARRRLVGDLAHEVRTPIAVLQGNLEELVDGVEEATPARLSSLHEEVLRLGSLVEQLDVLAGADAPVQVVDRDAVDLADIVRPQLEALRPHLDAKQLRVDTSLQPVIVHGDRVRLGQVVANLLSNAVKFTPAGGRIEVEVRAGERCAVLAVTDTGPGVPPADRARVFDRFWRGAAADAPAGRGIGLAIVSDIVRAHGGKVEVGESARGGARFVVTIPVAQ